MQDCCLQGALKLEVNFKELNFSTSQEIECINLTDDIKQFVDGCSVKEGLCLVFTLHVTASLIIQEDEYGILNDVKKKIREMFPKEGEYEHNKIDKNGNAHLSATFLQPFLMLPIRDGRLVLGTWQNIFFVEQDGPRELRTVLVEVIGNAESK